MNSADDGLVKGWKEDIDTLLVFVRSLILGYLTVLIMPINPGWSVLRSGDGFYHRILPVAGTSTGGCCCCTPFPNLPDDEQRDCF